ncbi:hypothetical protein PG994_012119 [Apiospora phragmitis]|uniref:Secreted protein n=1 Tax=Apiospora phragmitis TaxID=2905665 RepID=A0ABR1TXH2_9PEZI
MQIAFHLAAVLFGFCIAVTSSMPVANDVLPSSAQVTPDIHVISNGTEDGGIVDGMWDCYGADWRDCLQTLEANSSDCSTLATQVFLNTAEVHAKNNSCVGFTNGTCIAQLCSNSYTDQIFDAESFALQISVLSSCTNGGQNGVMASYSEDSFAGNCAWWQIWLQSSSNTTAGGCEGSD